MTGAPRSPHELRLIAAEPTPRPTERAPATVVHVLGGRADVVRTASVIRAVKRMGAFRQRIVATGAAAEREPTRRMRTDIGMPVADRHLDAGSGSDAEQTARLITAFERVVVDEQPTVVVVCGGGNHALACALVASRMQVAVAHLEAGVRSWDWTTTEEIDRVVTDRLSDTLFAHSTADAENLQAEGVPEGRIHAVGNTTIDLLRQCEARARGLEAWARHGLEQHGYVLVTLHRGSNIDDAMRLERIVEALGALADHAPVLFAIHARTRARLLDVAGVARLEAAGVICTPPLDYLEFISLELGAGAIVTDSSCVQDEASALGVDCYTLAPTAARSIAFTHGTCTLLGNDPAEIAAVRPSPHAPTPCAVPLWDGRAGDRVANVLASNYALRSTASRAP